MDFRRFRCSFARKLLARQRLMKLLLDTHAFLWWDTAPERLGQKARAACMDPANSLHLSHASVWEMQIKSQLGKLELRLPISELLRDNQTRNGLLLEPIELVDILHLQKLSMFHRDPFDRMLVAQAMGRGYQLVTHDALLPPYGVPILG